MILKERTSRLLRGCCDMFNLGQKNVRSIGPDEEQLKQFLKQSYHSRKGPDPTDPIIVEHLKNRDDVVVYGSQALVKQLPPRLARLREPSDWDVKTFSPRSFAKNLEKELEDIDPDTNLFKVTSLPVAGEDFDVYRIVENDSDEEVLVDVAAPKSGGLPESVMIDEVKYKALEAIKQSKIENLKDEDKKYRWDKERRDLNLIRKAERMSRGGGRGRAVSGSVFKKFGGR